MSDAGKEVEQIDQPPKPSVKDREKSTITADESRLHLLGRDAHHHDTSRLQYLSREKDTEGSRLHLGREPMDEAYTSSSRPEVIPHYMKQSDLYNQGHGQELSDHYEGHGGSFRKSNHKAPCTITRPPPDAGFSSGQLSMLDKMQQQQMSFFKSMLQDTVKEISRDSRSRSRSVAKSKKRKSRKRRYYSSSESESSSGSSRPSSYRSRSTESRVKHKRQRSETHSVGSPQRPDEHDRDARNDKDDSLSLIAPDITGDDQNKDQNTNQASISLSADPKDVNDNNKQASASQPLANPHEQVKGTMFENLPWWEEQRTKVLEQNKKDELLEKLKPDASIEHYFKAPDMPKSIRASMKKTKFESWKNDNSLWSIQEDMLRTALPLMKAIEKVQKLPDEQQNEIKPLLTSTGSLLGSTIQRMSAFRLRHSDPIIKDGYLLDVTPSMKSIYGEEWTQKVEEEEKIAKITQKALKNPPTSNPNTGKPKHYHKKDKSQYKGDKKKYKYRSGNTKSYGYNNQKSYHGANNNQSEQNQGSFRFSDKKDYQPKKYQKN